MNVRKPTDYSAMYGILDQLMGAEFPQMELYFEIGKIVCAHPEKGTAVMAAEYLQANYPGDRGFSPRNLRRMREFYRAYADNSELRALALKLGWPPPIVFLMSRIDQILKMGIAFVRLNMTDRWIRNVTRD